MEKRPFWSDLVIGFRLMSQEELVQRFPDHKFGQAFTTLKCECATYLPWLEKRLFPEIEIKVKQCGCVEHTPKINAGQTTMVRSIQQRKLENTLKFLSCFSKGLKKLEVTWKRGKSEVFKN